MPTSPKQDLLQAWGNLSVRHRGRSTPHATRPETPSTRTILEEIHHIEEQLQEKQRRLQEVEEFYDARHAEVSKKITGLDDKVIDLQRKRDMLDRTTPKLRSHEGPPGFECLEFVDEAWFDGIVALVILLNLMIVAMEFTDGTKDREFFWWDVGILLFYICEFIARLLLHQEDLLCGPRDHVWTYWFDLFVVLVGSLEMLAGMFHWHMGGWAPIFQCLRVVRVVKLVRLLKDTTWAEESPFQFFIMGVILCNAILVGVQMNHPYLEILRLFDNFMLAIFCFEIVVRVRNAGCRFFCTRNRLVAFYNWLDFTIVLLGMVEQWLIPAAVAVLAAAGVAEAAELEPSQFTMKLLRLVRLLRMLRLLRLIRDIPPLHTLAVGILESVQGMTWVFLLALLLLYAFGILCTQLIGHRILFGDDCPEAVVDIFPHVGESMFVLFKVMNADTEILDPLFQYIPVSKLLTAIFMILSNWAILAILTAVVSENLMAACANHRKKQEDAQQMKNRLALTKVFMEMDESGNDNGKLSKSEFEAKIKSEKESLEKSLKAAGIPSDLDNLRELFTLRAKQPTSTKEPQIELEDFVECLHYQHQDVSQRTLMRMEGRIKSLENLIKILLEEHIVSPKADRSRRPRSSPAASPLSLASLSP